MGLTINEEFIEIQIDSKYEIDFGIVNHLILKEIFNIPDIFISVSERLGISLFQKDLDVLLSFLLLLKKTISAPSCFSLASNIFSICVDKSIVNSDFDF
jgi:hypothetical protein